MKLPMSPAAHGPVLVTLLVTAAATGCGTIRNLQTAPEPFGGIKDAATFDVGDKAGIFALPMFAGFVVNLACSGVLDVALLPVTVPTSLADDRSPSLSPVQVDLTPYRPPAWSDLEFSADSGSVRVSWLDLGGGTREVRTYSLILDKAGRRIDGPGFSPSAGQEERWAAFSKWRREQRREDFLRRAQVNSLMHGRQLAFLDDGACVFRLDFERVQGASRRLVWYGELWTIEPSPTRRWRGPIYEGGHEVDEHDHLLTTLSREGRTVILVAAPGRNAYWVRAEDGAVVGDLTYGEGFASGRFAICTDRRRLACACPFGEGARIRVFSIDAPGRPLCELVVPWGSAGQWYVSRLEFCGPDHLIAVYASKNQVYEASVVYDTSTWLPVWRENDKAVGQPAVSPDGRSIAFLRDGHLEIAALPATKPR